MCNKENVQIRENTLNFAAKKAKRIIMKKYSLSILLALISISSYAATDEIPDPVIDLTCQYTRPSDGLSQLRPRTPVQVPVVSQSGHTLYIYSGCDNTTIELLDVNGQVVYTADVAEGTETLTLPASLTGTFELRIIRGSFTFVGEIDL